MLKKTILLVTASIILCSCVTGPRGYFKKSANNKLFDMFGFHGGKRQPLYNSKYIKQAKRNVARGDIDYEDIEEYDDEAENIPRDNIEIYKAMVQDDYDNRRRSHHRNHHHQRYPSIRKANHRVNQDHNHDAIRQELKQLKNMLNKTNEELSNKRCPTAQDMENHRSSRVRPVKIHEDSTGI